MLMYCNVDWIACLNPPQKIKNKSVLAQGYILVFDLLETTGKLTLRNIKNT